MAGLGGFDEMGRPPGQYGQFTGYQPVPGQQGAYLFDLANGGQRQFAGPPAEQLRGQIDAARGGYRPGDAAAAFAPQGAAPQVGQAAPAGPANDWTPYKTSDRGTQILLRKGGDPSNPLDLREITPGRAATKGGMAARGMTTQGGYNVDEQFLDQMETSEMKLAAAHEAGAAAAQQQSAARQGFFQEQRAQIEREQAVAAHEQAAKQKQIGELQAKYDKAEQAFVGFSDEQEAKANTGKAKLQTFVGGLAAALGALGASLARTPNFAAEAVERHNERELRKQEAELRIRKDAKDNLLGQLQQQMGSLDLARNAFRAIQSRQAELGWQQLASKESDEDKKTSMLQAAEIQNQNYLRWREQYVRGAEGEVTRTFQYVPGSSGSRGGVSTVRNADVDKRDPNAAGGAKLSDTSAGTLSNIATAKQLLPDVAEKSRAAGRTIMPDSEILGVSTQSSETDDYQAAANSLINVAAKAVEGDSASETHVKRLQTALLSGDPHTRQAAQEELYKVLDTKESQMRAVVPGAAPR